MVSFCLFFIGFFLILYFVCFGKILSQLEAASSVLPRIETFARCPRVVPSAAPRALRSGNALRFLCSVEPRTQLLILTYPYPNPNHNPTEKSATLTLTQLKNQKTPLTIRSTASGPVSILARVYFSCESIVLMIEREGTFLC